MKTKYARVGEQVKFVTPMVFVRVGYPLTLDDISEKFKGEVGDLLTKLGKVFDDHVKTDLKDIGLISLGHQFTDNFVQRALHNAACAFLLRRERFGGDERKIYQREIGYDDADIAGEMGTVVGKRMVRTGCYSPATGGNWSYDDYNEYEPAYLDDSTTHCIYTVEFTLKSGVKSHYKILASNCERVI